MVAKRHGIHSKTGCKGLACKITMLEILAKGPWAHGQGLGGPSFDSRMGLQSRHDATMQPITGNPPTAATVTFPCCAAVPLYTLAPQAPFAPPPSFCLVWSLWGTIGFGHRVTSLAAVGRDLPEGY